MSDQPEQAVDAAGSGAPPAMAHGSEGSDTANTPSLRWYQDVSLGRQLDSGGAPATVAAAWRWLLFAGMGFIGGQALALILVGVAALLAGQFHQVSALSKLAEPPTWFVLSTLLGLWGGFLGAAVLASRLQGTKRLVPDLGIRFRWIDALGIPIGVVSQFAIALLYVPIKPHVHDFTQRFGAPAQRLTGGSHGIGYSAIVVATVIGAPFFEELFFRGVLLRALARLFGRWGRWVGPAAAILISGVLFGLAHGESLQLLGLAAFGVVLGAVSYRTGRLGMNVVAHASFNAVALSAVVFPALVGVRGLV